MSLPPLANLFAVHRDDPSVLAAIAADLETSGEFAHVWRPAPGWVAATAPLPGGEPDSAAVRASGFAFAEGRDLVEGPWPAARSERLADAAERADVAPERLASIPGDFGFVRFRRDGGATVVRSCGGLAPFYLWQSGRDLAVSTRLGDLVRYLPEEPRLDPLVNAAWTMGYAVFLNRRTFLTDVTILDRGRAALLQPGRTATFQQYWHPRVKRLERPSAARTAEHASQLRTLLIEKLRRDLDPVDGNLLTLSGGVDSSSLAALAVGVVGRRVWTWSLLPGPKDLFDREMSYIAPLLRRFNIERTWWFRLWYSTAIVELLHDAPRVVFHVIHPALCALPAIVREAPVRVLFGGEFADEICGSGGTTPDWAAHTSLLRLFSSVWKLPSGPKDILRWGKHRALELARRPVLPLPGSLAAFIRPQIREEYADWHDQRRRDAARDRQERRFLALCTETAGFVTMNWEAASAVGVRRSFPFLNREILELAFECHPSELVGPGPKKLLRAALRDDVPAANLYRGDKGGWGHRLHAGSVEFNTSLPEVLRTVVRDEWMEAVPSTAGPSDVRGLFQLATFVKSLAAQRSARQTSAATSAGAVILQRKKRTHHG
jgi:asparagine synthetase B (glutamine-hydrolysing)